MDWWNIAQTIGNLLLVPILGIWATRNQKVAKAAAKALRALELARKAADMLAELTRAGIPTADAEKRVVLSLMAAEGIDKPTAQRIVAGAAGN